jgi:hypothetical protein
MKLYWIKSDFGYGDWSTPEINLTEKEALKYINERTGSDWESMEQYDNCSWSDAIYTIHDGEPEYNENWEDS